MGGAEPQFDSESGLIGYIEDDGLAFGADMEPIGEGLDTQLVLSPVGDLLLSDAHGQSVIGEVDDDRSPLAVLAFDLELGFV